MEKRKSQSLNRTSTSVCLVTTLVLCLVYYLSWDILPSDRGTDFALPQIRRQKYLDELVKSTSIISRPNEEINAVRQTIKPSHHDSLSEDDTTNKGETFQTQQKCHFSPNHRGSIRRIPHITNVTNGSSTGYRAFGRGLHWAKVGESTSITVKVHRATPRRDHYVSVLAVGEKHIFCASPSLFDSKAGRIEFTYVPKFAGNYTLFVEEISVSEQKQVPGSPFELYVDGPPISEENMRKRANRLPSCQTLPQTQLSWSYGNWVTRELAGDKRGTLRSGWVLQPDRCSIDIFTKSDLELAAASSTLKTIVILGRSTERGVFLSLTDLLLRREEKAEIYESVLWKCWGYMEIRLGNIRFIYQDFRIENVPATIPKDDKHVNITCHGTTVFERNDYFSNAIMFFKHILFGEIHPDVILMIVTHSEHLRLLVEKIPASWGGSLYAMNGFKVQRGPFYTSEGRAHDLSIAKTILGFDKHILALDGFALATPWRHATEIPPLIMRKAHWHRTCNEQNGEIKVCGDATEMVAQILLGKALAPKGKDAWLESLHEKCKPDNNETATMAARCFTVCNDCPNSLYPLNFNPVPNIKCYNLTSLKIRDTIGVKAYKAHRCPSECMKTMPVSQNAEGVDVRRCTMLKNDKNNISYSNLTIT